MEDVKQWIIQLEDKSQHKFCSYRSSYIAEKLKEVLEEQMANESQYGIHDYVDIAVHNVNKNNVCCKCTTTYELVLSRCPTCCYDADHHDFGFDPCYRLESQHLLIKPEMHVGEPCMVNACSYEALIKIMNHLKIICNVDIASSDDLRKWLLIQSNGVPYNVALNIQDYILTCKTCRLEIDKKGLDYSEWHDFLKEHMKNCLSDDLIDEKFVSPYKDILFMPGLGHVEMNEGKLLLKLLWYPINSHLSTLLGFRTPRGKDIVREGVDHHRTKQILSVCLEAIAKELLVRYVRCCIQNEKQPTVEEYQECLTSIEDNSYLFLYHIAFSYLLLF